MARETDVWQTAWIIAEQYGAEGVAFAAEMAHSFELCGKSDAAETWRAIARKVEVLTATADGAGQNDRPSPPAPS